MKHLVCVTLSALLLAACTTTTGTGRGPASYPSADISGGGIQSNRYAIRNFVGYGAQRSMSVDGLAYVAFPERPATDEEYERRRMICEAYVLAFSSSAEASGLPGKKFVTLWPLIDDGVAEYLVARSGQQIVDAGDCAGAVNFYDYVAAMEVISSARRSKDEPALEGRGPFLLAWSPANEKGQPGALALVLDFSRVEERENVVRLMRKWRNDIITEPSLWDNGWSVLELKVAISEMLESIGPGLVSFSNWLLADEDQEERTVQ